MNFETFSSRTMLLSSLLWSYSQDQLVVFSERNRKQRLEFKMLTMAFYARKIADKDFSRLDVLLSEYLGILNSEIRDATYFEPLDYYLSFRIDDEYLKTKLGYYTKEVADFWNNSDQQYPKFCFNAIIRSPLENLDSFFFESFKHTDYKPDFVNQLRLVLKFMNCCYEKPDDYMAKLNEAKSKVRLSILDPNRNKLIIEGMSSLL